MTPRWFPMKPHPQAQAIASSRARFIKIRAGRRAYKTEICKRRLVMCLPHDTGWMRPRYFYSAPTRPQAKEIAWQDFKDLIPRHWIQSVSETELKITTIFGSTLQVFGLNEPQRLEGGGFDGGVVDERSDVKPRAITTSILPALADRNGWLIESGVTKRQGVGARTFNEEFQKAAAGELPDTEAYSWSSDTVLTGEQLQLFRSIMDAKDYREQFEAEEVAMGGGVFYNWSDGNVRRCEYRADLPIIVASDFNVDPMCWVICQYHDQAVQAMDEIWMRDANTQKALDELWRKYQNHTGGFEFYGDATGSSRRTSASASDYIQIAGDKRFDKHRPKRVRYPKANPPVADRISSCVGMIESVNGQRRLFVDPACKRLIQDFADRVYREGTSDINDGPLVGHMTDAIGYYIHMAHPRKLSTGRYGTGVVTT